MDSIDVSELCTEADKSILTTTAIVQSGESKESNRGEDNEGGMSVEDLEGGNISEVHSGEQREEERGDK